MNTRTLGDENSQSGVEAETIKLLANSSYGYQIMEKSQQKINIYLSDKKEHKTMNSKFFRGLNYLNDKLSEVEAVKPNLEHNEPITVVFFSSYNTLSCARLTFITTFSMRFATSILSKR